MTPKGDKMRWRPSRVDVIVLLLIAISIVVVIVVPAYLTMRADRIALRLECANAASNVTQLRALASLEDELGIPVRFEIPEVSQSCTDLLGQ